MNFRMNVKFVETILYILKWYVLDKYVIYYVAIMCRLIERGSRSNALDDACVIKVNEKNLIYYYLMLCKSHER